MKGDQDPMNLAPRDLREYDFVKKDRKVDGAWSLV